jgi:hypothetical protein
MALVLENFSLLIASGITVSFLLLGATIGFAINRQLGKRKASSIANSNSLASGSDLKSQLHSLEFEKGLIAQALTRVSEAMTQGSISSSEYDRLTLQYKEKLRIYEIEIAELKSTSDYVEVQNLRNDLNYFLQHKMKQLDEKLSHLSKNEIVPDSKSHFLKESISSSNAPAAEQTRGPSHIFSQRSQTFSDQERKIQDTQHDIMIALKRLESQEFSEKEPNVPPINNSNKDALASFGRE